MSEGEPLTGDGVTQGIVREAAPAITARLSGG
jgi:hypothetical protein